MSGGGRVPALIALTDARRPSLKVGGTVLWVVSWSNKHANIHSFFTLTVDGNSCSNFLCADLSSMRDWDLALRAETSLFFHTLLSVRVFYHSSRHEA